ncbi:MAG: hypothetical protein H0X51_07885 [Parachlamydiaceae bacterium]|nr:hypothetical protein [Parachlamydiaceae bacterium]
MNKSGKLNKKAPVKTTANIPTWPRERDLATYAKYTCVDFHKELSLGKTWIDIGCRTGKAMSETQKLYNAHLIGVNAHKIDVLKGIESVFAEIPRDRSVYNNFKKSAHLLTDIYGAFTYDNDPIAALIYEACLLQPQGKAVIISLEAKFGNRVNREELQAFFEMNLGRELTFQRFRTYSDNSKTPLNSLRITIAGKGFSKYSLEDLLLKAGQLIGEPKKIRLLYRPPDHSVEIWKIVYKKPTIKK